MNVDEIKLRHDAFEQFEFCRTPDDIYDHADLADAREIHQDRGFLLAEVERLQKNLVLANESCSEWADLVETAESNLARLVVELEKHVAGDYPRAAKWSQCSHGKYGYQDCEACNDDHIQSLIDFYRTTADRNVSDRLIESEQEKRNG